MTDVNEKNDIKIKDNIKISVIIPAYNVEDYLPECLESCISQHFEGAEYICVDDGSSDGTYAQAERYADAHAEIKLLHKENCGVSSARNAGLRAAKGKVIMFLDADDKLKRGAIERIWQCFSSDKCPDIVIFNADTFPADIEDLPWYKKTLQFQEKYYDHFVPQILFAERGSMPFVWRHAYRAELIKDRGIYFDETLNMGEDAVFPMSIFPSADRFMFIEESLISYRMSRDGSLMEVIHSDPVSVVDKHYDAIISAASFWNGKGWLCRYGTDFLEWALKFTLLKVKALKGKEKREKAAEFFERIAEPFELAKYKGKLSFKGKLMWIAFCLMAG